MLLSFIQLILSLVANLTAYARDKKLIEAGSAQAVLKGVQDADEAIRGANAARTGELPDVANDPNNRDNEK